MSLYHQFLSLPIDREALGLEPRDADITHFCTPKDARILGWAGVDGIHYCTVPLLGSTVFAVTPMDGPPYVRPIAGSFGDLLSLLLACGSMDAICQAFMMDDRRFAQFIRENPPLPEQQAALDAVARELNITPAAAPCACIRELQAGFDHSSIPYTEEYYDMTGETPPAVPWNVFWNRGFGGIDSTPGQEIPIGKSIPWGREVWHIPAIYRFDQGLVVDFCIEVEPARVRAFIDKWDLLHEDAHDYTPGERRQIEQEHPLSIDFTAALMLDGETLRQKNGYGISWIAPDCLDDLPCQNTGALALLEHYRLDPGRCWSFHRATFPHEGIPALRALTLRLERRPTELPACAINTPKAGESFPVVHPLTGKEYTLTVHETEAQKLDTARFGRDGLEYPTHFTAMSYTLEPALPPQSFRLWDAAPGDPVRHKTGSADGPVSASSIGIIGGAAGASALGGPHLHTACSSLHFEPADHILWQFSFLEKLLPDLEADLL